MIGRMRTQSPHGAALLVAGLFAAAPATSLAGAPITFAPGPVTVEYAISLALADFNGDGKLDLFTASCPDVELRLGDGMGAFGAQASSTMADSGQCHLAAGDLNGDGIPDVAVVFGFTSPSSPGRVAVFFSDGAGGLVDGPVLSVADYPSSVAIGDLNGDGVADLVVGSALTNPLTVVLGTGGGAFASGTTFSSGGRPVDVVIGDFNHDGKKDIAAAVSDTAIAILLGNGDGTFGTPAQFAAGSYPTGIAASDFDGDGNVDLAVANDGTDSVSLLYGDGAGGFAAPVAVYVGQYPFGVRARDLNDDGAPDLIVNTTVNGGVGADATYALRNLGNRTFEAPTQLFVSGYAGIVDLAPDIGDLNGDGRPDVVITDTTYGAYIKEFLNTTKFPERKYDFDGDEKSDVLWRNTDSGDDYIFFMNGTAVLGSSNYTNPVPDPAWQIVGIGDFDGDRNTDILWRNVSTGENYIFLMDGATVKPESNYINSVSAPWTVAGVGDFNGDGYADILWRNSDTGENYIFFMNGTSVQENSDYINSVSDLDWQTAGIGDFDGDGRSDILWRNLSTGEDYIFVMDSTSLTERSGYTNSVSVPNWQIAGVGDYNGDGKADILWRNNSTGENYVFFMDNTNVLSASGYTNPVDPVWQIAATGDYNGDRNADILWRNMDTGENYIFFMNGTTVLGASNYTQSVPDLTWQVQNPK